MFASSPDYAALMLDYAAGALSPAFQLVVEAHFDLRPDALHLAADVETAGGVLLERITPVPVAATPLPTGLSEEPQLEGADALAGVRARIGLAASGEDGLAWRPRFFGFMEHRLPIAGASLIKIPAGRAMPRHTHEGDELTLVLRGSFSDERGIYERGEIVFADRAVEHTPRVRTDEECVCLIAETGAIRLRTWWGRALPAGWTH
jgi:putative transcriptional regulator